MFQVLYQIKACKSGIAVLQGVLLEITLTVPLRLKNEIVTIINIIKDDKLKTSKNLGRRDGAS